MKFFDVPPPPAVEEMRSDPLRPEPPWEGPPHGTLPSYSNQRAVVVVTKQVALVVDHLRVYPNGLIAPIQLLVNPSEPDPGHTSSLWGIQTPTSGDWPTELLRIGFEFADGARWTNLDWDRPMHDGEPAAPSVRPRGGGGDRHFKSMEYWVWPLPPPGPLKIAAMWPIHNIPETIIELDANELRQRATEAKSLWD